MDGQDNKDGEKAEGEKTETNSERVDGVRVVSSLTGSLSAIQDACISKMGLPADSAFLVVVNRQQQGELSCNIVAAFDEEKGELEVTENGLTEKKTSEAQRSELTAAAAEALCNISEYHQARADDCDCPGCRARRSDRRGRSPHSQSGVLSPGGGFYSTVRGKC